MKCHAETAGPFVYEHAVVKTEGCVACHFAARKPESAAAEPRQREHDLPAVPLAVDELLHREPIGPAHNQATQYQSCTICHTDIHGSNVSAVFFNTK